MDEEYKHKDIGATALIMRKINEFINDQHDPLSKEIVRIFQIECSDCDFFENSICKFKNLNIECNIIDCPLASLAEEEINELIKEMS